MGDSDLRNAKEGELTTTRERAWGQYKRPSDGVLVRLPADPEARQRYIGKGFKLIRTGTENEIPQAIIDTSEEALAKIAPVAVAVKEPEPPVEPSEPEAGERELYVSDKPPKEKKAKRKKRKLKT